MKEKLKKLLASLAAVIMAVGMMAGASVPVMADTSTPKGQGNFTVTITGVDEAQGHNFVAYQILKGDLVEKTGATQGNTGANLVLSNIEWGDGVTSSNLLNALHTASETEGNVLYGLFPASTVTDAASFADALSKMSDDANTTKAVAEIINSNLTTTTTGTAGTSSVSGLTAGYYFIKDTGTFSGDKAGAYTRYILQVVHSVSIATKASVPQITKEVKEVNDTTGGDGSWGKIADYDIGDSVPFRITGTLPSNFNDYKQYTTYTITDHLSTGLTAPSADDITIKVGDTDVKDHFNVQIVDQAISISLKSGEDLTKWTNPSLTSASTFVIEYSSVLNSNAVKGTTGNTNKVHLTFSNDPNADGSGKTDETPDDVVKVVTLDLIVNKVDSQETPQPLTGAHFALFKKYNTVPEGKTKETSITYGSNQTYTFSSTENWIKVDEITSGSTFTFSGLDSGSYLLVETETPSGYNSIDPISFDITATLDGENQTITKINGADNEGIVSLGTLTNTKVALTDSASSLTATVQNRSGSFLPSTGGMGTTIFYVIGGVLVAGAVILLISRKRRA